MYSKRAKKSEFQSTLPVRGATEAREKICTAYKLFQSTLPVRGATSPRRKPVATIKHFNPRSPCGERHLQRGRLPHAGGISIHAPRAGSDRIQIADSDFHADFNPRSPCGERPAATPPRLSSAYFNPRSPCGERPPAARADPGRGEYFNPRSPCGERQRCGAARAEHDYFNPHSPCGERQAYQ